jgi:hypothetical protein
MMLELVYLLPQLHATHLVKDLLHKRHQTLIQLLKFVSENPLALTDLHHLLKAGLTLLITIGILMTAQLIV